MNYIIIWQSLVSSSYRSFFVKLARSLPDDSHLTLVAPQRFVELGGQTLECEPFKNEETRINFNILEAKTFHTQCVVYRGLPALLKTFPKHENHVLICLSEPYSITSLWVYLMARWHLKKFFFMTYALQNIKKSFSPAIAFVQHFIYRVCKVILSLGKEQSEVLRLQGYTKRIISFPLWFDPKIFYFEKKVRNKKIKIGYVGSLTEAKGVSDLLNCFDKHVELFSPLVSIHLVGRGMLAAAMPDAIENLKKRGVEAEYLGPLPSKQVAAFFREMDVLIVPSRTCAHWKEQFGRVIVEAQACGCIVVGSSSGEIPNVIGRSEWIFEEGNLDAMKDVLLCAVQNLHTDIGLPQRESERAFSRFSDDVLAQSFAAELRTII